ncbi:hypothetical protein EVAR_74518_1 [Eumeta japonica]|uniref:Uncharacterized protein n=1 Tax=Eumeta variegata TaxID=151549 RepID=A0A4C1TBI0_EUMVA|nr:hypothetical protein EVAR_74518_1 [Eumeta japonica]
MSNIEDGANTKTVEVDQVNGNAHENTRKGWVKFDDETAETKESSEIPIAPSSSSERPAVLNTETVHVNLDRERSVDQEPVRPFKKNVEFVNVRHGFCE